MPTVPNTWAVLQAMQYLIQTQVLVSSVSPFSLWTPDDQLKYGTDNPNGSITNCIHIGVPKEWASNNLYPNQCHIIPPMSESVSRHALGGKVWDEDEIIVLFWVSRKDDYYAAMKTIVAMRDAIYPMLAQHAELPGAPTVVAGKIRVGGGSGHSGYVINNIIGEDWDGWGFTWWVRQEWFITGGFTN
jgi:hypothetical protein